MTTSGNQHRLAQQESQRAPVRSRLMIAAAFSFLSGIWLAPHTQVGLWPWLLVLAVFPTAFFLRKSGYRAHIAAGLFFFAMGLLWTQVWLNPAVPGEGVCEIHGRVYGDPTKRSEGRMAFLLGDVSLDGQATAGLAYCTLSAYGDDPMPTLSDGMEIQFTGRVYHPQGQSGRYGFDFRLWLYQNRISYGIASIKNMQLADTAGSAPWYDWPSRLRGLFRWSLESVMGEESRLAMAMLFGDREGMAQDENAAFQRAGIAHLLSVSGLHVGMMGGLVLWALNALRVRKRWRLPIMFLFLVGYCALTGFSTASTRAAIMMLMALAARGVNRKPDPLVTLSSAMLLVLCLNPLQLFSAGFTLSFCAMAGIMLLRPRLMEAFGRGARNRYQRRALLRRTPHSRIWERVKKVLGDPVDLLALSISAQAGVLLPTAMFFHQLPLYGLVINITLVPLAVLLVPLYFITLILSPIPYLGIGAGWISQMLSAGFLALVRLLSTLPYASVRVPSASGFVIGAAVIAAVLCSRYYRGRLKQRIIALSLTAAIALLGSVWASPNSLRYIQLSVGRADAALVMDGRTTLMIDAGEYGDAASGYLLAEGRNLDALFFTHLHADHTMGALDLLNAGITIGKVYIPVGAMSHSLDAEVEDLMRRLEADNIPIVELAAGDELRYNKVSLTVLWPGREQARATQDANHMAMALSICFDGYTLLATGDLTGLYEAYAAVPADVLKLAHHGSAESTNAAFLDFVSPQFAIISCARGDSVLPSQATLNRLAERNIPVYRTDEAGEITLTVRNGHLLLSTYQGGNEH